MTEVSLSSDVVVIDGVLRVSSLEIIERLCKQHSHVLEGIREISLECKEDFNESNFRLVEYADAKGEMRPCTSYYATALPCLLWFCWQESS